MDIERPIISNNLRVEYTIFPYGDEYVVMKPILVNGDSDISHTFWSRSYCKNANIVKELYEDKYRVLVINGEKISRIFICESEAEAGQVRGILYEFGYAQEIIINANHLLWIPKAMNTLNILEQKVTELYSDAFLNRKKRKYERKMAMQKLIWKIKGLFSIRRKNNDIHA